MMFEIRIGSWQPNRDLGAALEAHAFADNDSGHHYLYADEQKRVVEHLNLNSDVIVALALRNVPCSAISACFGVSREAIARRLRPLGFLNPPGVRGPSRKRCRLGVRVEVV